MLLSTKQLVHGRDLRDLLVFAYGISPSDAGGCGISESASRIVLLVLDCMYRGRLMVIKSVVVDDGVVM